VITPRRDASGKPIGYLVISKDSSDEIRLTEQLKATQLYTRSLIESNIDALITTDINGIINDVNQQMVALTGCAETGIKLALCEGRIIDFELTARARDGTETAVSYNATTFNDQEGKLQGVFATARDVSERKRYEQTVRT
jgi:PAS domain-containing protein